MIALAWILIVLGLAWLGFAYAGYPLVLRFLAPAPSQLTNPPSPPISVIITVHNGAGELPAALDRMLAQPYSGTRELIVASDGSTDGTDEIAVSYADRGVRLIRNDDRGGKEAAQACAIAEAAGEILVFCDVGSELGEGALEALVAPFQDPAIGSVSSEDEVRSTGGEGAYVKYEMWLRRRESETTGLIGLSGSCFAARRALCTPWPSDLASDFRTALETARRGLRAVSAPEARVEIRTTNDPAKEWNRKVRTVRRGLAVLFSYRDLLQPSAGRRIWIALWGHKVARFTAPFALIAVLLISLLAAPFDAGIQIFLFLQILAYAMAGLGLAWSPAAEWLPIRLAAFFVLVNASMLVAWRYHFRGERAVLWTPTKR